eukprot:356323-Chlamydomonas_euryale.AAC.2
MPLPLEVIAFTSRSAGGRGNAALAAARGDGPSPRGLQFGQRDGLRLELSPRCMRPASQLRQA